ncbi:MAG: hypothetical protein ABGX33_02405 [Cycloclasticus sp.]
MNSLKLIIGSLLLMLLIACDNESTVTEIEKKTVVNVVPVQVEAKVNTRPGVKLSETAQIDIEIRRIEDKLKTNPTVKGWMLVGDAQMHLKKYNEAVWAYREAYMLSKFADGPRRKLRRAVALAGLEPENQRYEEK